ncbi:MAG TPA: CCA tRNA nucleotidyltransferase [Weissella thailandensis]|uniref:CCA tRNA nucleotidyltransferase n=1 Tax=Weissella thailandensis TaxID=89061 RepID=UPI001DBCDF3B|nr:CCA tRNA nucleotidyltransferase [Weissella thailandensis]HJG85262.1 CCA tRNA nucleotidyltransferase [Weissella thailandensis]
MKINKMPSEFIDALPILETIEKAGYEAYFVGGSVRDTMLSKPIHDVDIATSAYPEEIKKIFKRTVDTGIEHGTVMILDHGTGYETTTFRTESTYTDFRRPDEVKFVRSLDEDLKRRDFTVNALALTKDGEVIDLFGGVQDMSAQILRAVGKPEERFHEDALRMMRAVRFAAQLDFKIDDATQKAIAENAPLLANIAVERTNVEFTKLMQGTSASYGLIEMIKSGLVNFMPGLANTDQDLAAYAELLQNAQPTDDNQAWSLLSFELGLSPKDTGEFLKLWKQPNDMIQTAKAVIALMNKLRLGDVSDWDLYQTQDAITTALATIRLSEVTANVEDLSVRYQALPIKHKKELAINGGELMKSLHLTPGPLFGKILADLEHLVVIGEQVNDKAALLQAAADIVEKEKK